MGEHTASRARHTMTKAQMAQVRATQRQDYYYAGLPWWVYSGCAAVGVLYAGIVVLIIVEWPL